MIELREIEYQDIPNVQKYASHPAIGQMSYVPSPYPNDGAAKWYEIVMALIQKGTVKVYIIELEGQFAGIITLNDLSIVKNRVNVDYWVRADFQRKCVGSNAISLALEYAQKMGIENYYSGCLARNVGSQKALLKNGFSIYDQFILKEGKYKGEKMLLLHKLCA
ncbi:GNAT family N-acetyltransferase [Photobacterium damselae subsp. damselae]|uniref:GNAT family N-acetyltransferase n=1 Tax=Photobacterium damselae TaxID=38293 RepID=UPI001F2B9DFD|nr:GNAT family N-acetyltransferase [Photobacterium damselae]UKA07498.1 GNAT family N-acetyltransferase [Photobacterium damselae subsp. damselae]UKA22604.1 GNAT family N-acetyltransferase [Photobacterium damselae subsp. damselae]